jgi:hypothetical protein
VSWLVIYGLMTDDLVVGPDDSVFDALGKASRN